MILTDNETKVDLLNNEAISKTIIELLRPTLALFVDLIEKNAWRDSLNRWWWLEVKRAKCDFCVGSC